jgi:hypothetical protein
MSAITSQLRYRRRQAPFYTFSPTQYVCFVSILFAGQLCENCVQNVCKMCAKCVQNV